MTWVRLDEQFAQHPKIKRAGPEAMALHVAALCYCNQYLTDGQLPSEAARTLIDFSAKKAEATIQRLVNVGLWEPIASGYQIHDYLEYQPSKQVVLQERSKKQAAGKAGGQAAAKARAQAKGQAESKPVPVSEPVSGGDVETSQNRELRLAAERVNDACLHPDWSEAANVVLTLSEHIDVKLIDECAGWAMERDDKYRPRSPRFFLTTCADWARQRGVDVPDLGKVPS